MGFLAQRRGADLTNCGRWFLAATCLLLFLPMLASADPTPSTSVVTINDSTGSISMGVDFASCFTDAKTEGCFGIVDSFGGLYVFNGPEYILNILEPDGSAVSDTLEIVAGGSTHLTIDFVSAVDPTPLAPLACVPSADVVCETITETGGLQAVPVTSPMVYTVDGRVAENVTVQFVSGGDVAAVPEPSAIPMLLLGIGAAAAANRRIRKRRSDPTV